MKMVRILLILILFMISVQTAFAHPHVYLNAKIQYILDDSGVYGIRQEWAFDEMYSSALIMEFDTDRNGRFEKSEIRKLKQNAFGNLKKYNYFNYIKIDGKRRKIKRIDNFKALIINDNVVYSFEIPLDTRINDRFTDIQIALFDKRYYFDVRIVKEMLFENNTSENFVFGYSIFKDKDKAFYFNLIEPQAIQFKMAKGLNTGNLEFSRPPFALYKTVAGNSEKISEMPANKMSGYLKGGFHENVKNTIIKYQDAIDELVIDKLRLFKKTGNTSLVISLIFFAFLFGVVHALGPGHGKLVSSSYFLNDRNGGPLRVITMNILMSSLHALMGVGIVFFLKVVLDSFTMSSVNNVINIAQFMSAMLIVITGFFMVLKYGRQFINKLKRPFDVYRNGFGDRRDVEIPSKRGFYSLIFAVGIVPCSGTLMLLLFCVILGLTGLGLFLVIFIILGMATTISFMGVIAWLIRSGFLKYSVKNQSTTIIPQTLRLISSLLILTFGILFLIGKLLMY